MNARPIASTEAKVYWCQVLRNKSLDQPMMQLKYVPISTRKSLLFNFCYKSKRERIPSAPNCFPNAAGRCQLNLRSIGSCKSPVARRTSSVTRVYQQKNIRFGFLEYSMYPGPEYYIAWTIFAALNDIRSQKSLLTKHFYRNKEYEPHRRSFRHFIDPHGHCNI